MPFLVAVVFLSAVVGWWRFTGEGRAGAPPPLPAVEDAAVAQEPLSPEDPGIARRDVREAVQRFAELGRPILCGGGNQPVVALTFDDGPGPYTERTFRALRSYGARATFFVNGIKLEDQFLDVLPRLHKVGEIGNHTWNHENLVGAGPEVLAEEVDALTADLEGRTGKSVRVFRPPFGSLDDALLGHARSRGLVTVLWTVDSTDAHGVSAEEEWAVLEEELRPGAIILLHENRGTTQDILGSLLELVAARGLTPVTVPELLAVDPPSAEQLEQGTCPDGSGGFAPPL